MELLYYKDAYLKECKSIILDSYEEDGKYYVILDNNIFYPQGGGQKGDKGNIILDNKIYEVINCIKDENKNPIVITNKMIEKDNIGKEVMCKLNWEYRYKQMKLHTSLHILHYLLEQYYNKQLEYPISSNIEDDFAYNKYPMELINDEVINYIQNKMNELFNKDIDVITYPSNEDEKYRYWKCMNYVIPCGGVHVKNLMEIKKINIECHTKKGITTVKIML